MSKGGKDWDKCLGSALLSYQTAPQVSTGQSLLYGKDTQLQNFNYLHQHVPCPTTETE